MSIDLDLVGRLAGVLPQGPSPAADPGLVSTGRVLAVDHAAGTVEVEVRGATLLLPALAARYGIGGAAVVLHSPAEGRPVLVIGAASPASPVAAAPITAVAGNTVTVTWNGVATPLPAIPSTYTTTVRAWVFTNDRGAPVLVLGPTEEAAPEPPPPPPEPPPPATQQVTVSIGAQWSGTFRHIRGAWDRWNTDRYGGRSTLYQGNKYGSGQLNGLAVYGAQLTNLGAISIDRVRVKLNGVGLSGAEGTPVVQGSPHGSQPGGAPSGTGGSASGWGWVDLPADIREQMRTGAVRGLVLVGPGYNAVGGAGNGDGMVLSVTFTRRI
jgi:hypothetical protein